MLPHPGTVCEVFAWARGDDAAGTNWRGCEYHPFADPSFVSAQGGHSRAGVMSRRATRARRGRAREVLTMRRASGQGYSTASRDQSRIAAPCVAQLV